MSAAELMSLISRHPCVACGRSYKQKCHLNYHIRYECNKEPQFGCPFCTYRAKQKSALKTHLFVKHREAIVDNSQ
ncbi:hypothetical protein J6590_014792 [Homalodisca vitripennis]|nr:hypothetical protein J6590_014792 [Homalodisca vitripennis]